MTILFHSELDDPAPWIARLAALLPGEELRVWPDTGDPARVRAALLWTQPPGGLGLYSNLRFVQSLGAGVNQLDLPALPRGVRVARLIDPGMTVQMGDYCLAAVLRHHRRLDAHARAQAEGRWAFEAPMPATRFPVGVLGLGVLGGAVAARFAANGYPVRGWARTPRDVPGVAAFAGRAALPAFLDGLAALVCLLPLTAETEGILDAALFAALPRGAFLVNAGRGAHLNEPDLLVALESGQLAGATLDVLREEPPPPDHPFWFHPRVLLTPHVAALADPETAGAIVAENFRRAARGEAPRHEVDPARGY